MLSYSILGTVVLYIREEEFDDFEVYRNRSRTNANVLSERMVPSQNDFAPSWVWNVTPSKKALLKTIIKCICPQGSCYSHLCTGTST